MSFNDSNIATVSINVTDQAPVATDVGPASALHGQSTSFHLASNVSDPDSDPLSVSIVQQPSHGNLYLDYYTGNYLYTANYNYTGPDTFTFMANDGALNSNTATVSINVTDQAPVATDIGPVSVLHGQSTSFNLASKVSDPDGETPTVSIVQQPAHGSLYFDSYTANYIYTANANYTGPDSFTFKANDGAANSNVATSTINVTSLAADIDYEVAENETFAASAGVGLLTNLYESWSQYFIVATITTNVGTFSAGQVAVFTSGSVLTVAADGSLTFTSAANFIGTATFTFTATYGGATEGSTIRMVVADPATAESPGEMSFTSVGNVVYSQSSTDYDTTFTVGLVPFQRRVQNRRIVIGDLCGRLPCFASVESGRSLRSG